MQLIEASLQRRSHLKDILARLQRHELVAKADVDVEPAGLIGHYEAPEIAKLIHSLQDRSNFLLPILVSKAELPRRNLNGLLGIPRRQTLVLSICQAMAVLTDVPTGEARRSMHRGIEGFCRNAFLVHEMGQSLDSIRHALQAETIEASGRPNDHELQLDAKRHVIKVQLRINSSLAPSVGIAQATSTLSLFVGHAKDRFPRSRGKD